MKGGKVMNYWCDGAGWNGCMSGWFVCNDDGQVYDCWYRERKTNNEMEYEGILKALEVCNVNDVIFTDSQLVCYQIQGVWKCKEPRLFGLLCRAVDMCAHRNVSVKWIGRKFNKAGYLIENSKERQLVELRREVNRNCEFSFASSGNG